MRKPDGLRVAYIDFDSFFVTVEEQARPHLRGKPVGVIPFHTAAGTCIIAANKIAKARGVTTGMAVREARIQCPDLVLQPQSPDLYVRAHRKLVIEIEHILPVGTVCSIDELTCPVDSDWQKDPAGLAAAIKEHLRKTVGPYITCSIGMGPNRLLAKIASEIDKPDGATILHPDDLPGRLLDLRMSDLPGIGSRMRHRLAQAGIHDIADLWNSQPRQLRALWGTVNGERFWYALHGYDIAAKQTARSMYGHGRILPPDWRNMDKAWHCARLLTVKACRRLRRDGFVAGRLGLWLSAKEGRWDGEHPLDDVNDDRSSVQGLANLWEQARDSLPDAVRVKKLHVALYRLRPAEQRQFSLFGDTSANRQKWSTLSRIMDGLNGKYARTLVSLGPWTPPPGGYAGGKIAFARIPDMEDFW